MLSYRHAFHAGNHADVLKHVVLVRILDQLTAKDKPLRYIETHAGAGGYALTSPAARKNREYRAGIELARSAPNAPAPVARLIELTSDYNGDARELVRYPGSPWLARRCLRAGDSIYLFELHGAEHDLLERNCRADRRVKVLREDGFAGCIGLVPPPERRGLVFIDPSYEAKTEQRRVVDALVKAHRRFATGVYAIWHPVIERRRADAFERALKAARVGPIELYELAVAPDAEGRGMTASRMLVVNPPWKLAAELDTSLRWLAQTLGTDGRGAYRITALG